MFVATTSSCTCAGRVSRKRTVAESRNPSPFGLTVVSSGESPAKGTEPFDTWRSRSAGPGVASAETAASSRAVTALQFPYFPMMQGTIERSILNAMRRLLTFAMLVMLVLPAASAARTDAPNDGTLSVTDARGTITINGRGAVIGSFAKGSVTISDPIDGDGTGPIVTGDDFPPIDRDENTTTWRGTKVRFRIIGGTFKVVVRGRGI